MIDSRFASKLRELGFVPDDALTKETERNRTGYLKGRPTFLASPPGSEPITIAVDDTGQVWVHKKQIDLSSCGFENMWHPVLTPLRFTPAPDFPDKHKVKWPAYFVLRTENAYITMAIDETGKCWQTGRRVDLWELDFNEYDATLNRIYTH